MFESCKFFYKKKIVINFIFKTEGDPQDRDNDKKEDYYECIIETGFSLYFLILHYLELDIKELDAG